MDNRKENLRRMFRQARKRLEEGNKKSRKRTEK